MADFKSMRVLERVIYSKVSIGVLIVLLFFSINAVWNVYDKFREASLNRDEAQEEYVLIEDRVIAIQNDVSLLKTERGTEKIIREEFGFAKEGEGAIVIVEEAINTQETNPREKSFLGSIWEGIQGIF